VPLLVALFWLALPGGRANADLITYDFSGTGDSQQFGKVTITGSFTVDSQTIQNQKGALKSADLQTPFFSITDGTTYNVVNSASTFTVNTTTFDVISANLILFSSTTPGIELDITGSAAGFWSEVSENPANGTGTWSHTTAATVPAPPSLALLGLGALCVTGYAWRRRRLAAA
jgi:hypothetical protein